MLQEKYDFRGILILILTGFGSDPFSKSGSGSDLSRNTDPDSTTKTPGSATLVTANCNNTLVQIQTRTLKGDAAQKPNWTI